MTRAVEAHEVAGGYLFVMPDGRRIVAPRSPEARRAYIEVLLRMRRRGFGL